MSEDAAVEKGDEVDAPEVPVRDAVIVFVNRHGDEISVDVASQGDVRATEITTLLQVAQGVWAQKIGG